MNGNDLIDYIADVLRARNIRVYDSNIINEIAKIDAAKLKQLIEGRK